MAPQVKSKQRVADHGEVFTNEREVNAMLDLVKDETERIDSRFLEPACGNGNFLAPILERKLAVVTKRYKRSVAEWEKNAFVAVASVYGVELLPDNVTECRIRLYKLFCDEYERIAKQKASKRYLGAIQYVLSRNILCGDALTLLQADGTPIVFSEWSMVMGGKVKRRDFRLDQMLDGTERQMSIFQSDWEYDEETNTMIPTPIREYPLVDFYMVEEVDAA